MLDVAGGHRPRRIHALGLQRFGGWAVKHYGVAVRDDGPRAELVHATRRAAGKLLPTVEEAAHGLAFTVAHDAGDFSFALVAWWALQNEVHQRVFSAELETPGELRAHPTPAIGCIWELAVHDFERRAWIEHMLADPRGPQPDAYTRTMFEGVI